MAFKKNFQLTRANQGYVGEVLVVKVSQHLSQYLHKVFPSYIELCGVCHGAC
jgi:hypothetical protein